ncbi:MAG: septal ring lytic transglycosylase RlpA family protein [Xanthomonadales bacterium]|nr:septal ring lytic transglycosylase RlpA family protein [Xanthomonadales bacterium]NIN60293.1 septal ring lytic transglycosylase RlpA family protein [Xanthomonadales bacterium]NIN75645.1 septal ring lytic transglycosylase RlpA family protein [Xanthomonadales bacterium]NIO14718.1 septal ring lytic transglycosylase RlpA family protein [Xanthomonadales bacterium]NIP12686.1 septal ring lytic transglycosylase RlpA family protein [Xanthomonadales bacterium]
MSGPMRWALPCAVLLLAACAGEVRRPDDADGPSARVLRPADVADAIPRPEPRSRYGNRSPYEVLGKQYYVMDSSAGYQQRGVASWYGSKFHGRKTSSGEVFDMHKATAAHRELPLPTYAEVTNLDNGRSVVVKINDRGPFHDQRLIDLSYGAAVRLGMVADGTAQVEVRAIHFEGPQPPAPAVKVADGTFLQVGAFSDRNAAEHLAGRMMAEQLEPVVIQRADGLYKVWIGPYQWESEIEQATRRVIELGMERPHKVRR